MRDNGDTVAAMPEVEPPQPCVPHHPRIWRTANVQLRDLRAKHHDDVDCTAVNGAEAAAFLVEAMDCKQCRTSLPVMLNDLLESVQVDGGEFVASVIAALTASVAHADRTIRQGMDVYRAVDEDVQERVRQATEERKANHG
jgi:hypothetical protein